MDIIVHFDASVNAGNFSGGVAEELQFENAVDYVVNLFDSVFVNPVTINIDVGWGEYGQGLNGNQTGNVIAPYYLAANSWTNPSQLWSYGQIAAALKANSGGSDTQNIAYSHLPATDPTGGQNFEPTIAEAEALGLTSGFNGVADAIGISTIPYPNGTWDFDTSTIPGPGAPTSSETDFVGVFEHELTEGLGRDSNAGRGGVSTPLDLFRYSAPGAVDPAAVPVGSGNTAYFSIDGGVTSGGIFNNDASLVTDPVNHPLGNPYDLGDWTQDSGTGPNGVDEFGTGDEGVLLPLTLDDLEEMNVIGWNTAASSNDIPQGVTDYISTGVLAGDLNVLTGGYLVVGKGGSFLSATLEEQPGPAGYGAFEDVSGTDSEATIYAGDYAPFTNALSAGQRVDSGGIAISATVIGGAQLIEVGGSATDTTLSGTSGGPGQQIDVPAIQGVYGTASGTTIDTFGEQYIYGGGVNSAAIVNAAGFQEDDGVDHGSTVYAGGMQLVDAFSYAVDETISGGVQIDGGLAGLTQIESGGTQSITSAGSANETTVLNGGFVDIYGTATGMSVSAGGSATVYDGGIVANGNDSNGFSLDTLDDGTLVFDQAGLDDFQGQLVGTGALVMEGTGTLIVNSAGGFSGPVTISAGTLELASATAIGDGTISFGPDAGGTLRIDGAVMPTNTITGLIAGDAIDLASVPYNPLGSATVATGNKLQVTENGTTYVVQLDPAATYNSSDFLLSQDGNGGTIVSEAVPFSGNGGKWSAPLGSLVDVLINSSTTIVDTNPEDKPNKSNGNPQLLADAGTVLSLAVTNVLIFDYGALTTEDDFINKFDTAIDIGSFDGGQGGSQLTVGGALINDLSLRIGNPNLLRATTVTANGLLNLIPGGLVDGGTIDLIGSATNQATLEINAAAGTGTAGVLTGVLDIEGLALLSFTTGSFATIASNSSLLINGVHAFVANDSSPGQNSALSGLTTNDGGLDFENGASASLTGSLVNNDSIILDNAGDGGENGDGGSLLVVQGLLTNNGQLSIGNAHLTSPDEISVGSLDNTNSIVIAGSSAAPGSLVVTGNALDSFSIIIDAHGSMSVGGNYQQTFGTLNFQAVGTGAGQYGTLAVAGALDLPRGTGAGSSIQVTPTVSFAAGTVLTLVTFAPGELSGMFGSVVSGNGTYINLGNGLTAGVLYNDSLGNVQYEYVATPSTTADTWTAGATGAWNTSADWSAGAPTFYTDATLGAGAVVTLNSDATIDSLTLGADSSLTVNAGYSLSIGAGLTLDAGAALTVDGEMTINSTGFLTILGNVSVAGSLDVRGVSYNGSGPVSGGTFTIDSGATLELDARNYNNVAFGAAGGTLILTDPGQFDATISGFGQGESLEISGTVTGVTYNAAGQDLVLTNNGSTVATLAVGASNNFSNTHFVTSTSGNMTTIQAVAPQIMGLTESPPSGSFMVGQTVELYLNLNEAVTVTGAPTLMLNNDGVAAYDATNSTSTMLAFRYTVAQTDTSTVGLVATALATAGGATIEDSAGLSLAAESLVALTQLGPQISVPQGINWNGGTGSWNVAGGWTPAVIPVIQDDVYITATGTNVVDSASTNAAAELTLSTNSTLNINSDTLTVRGALSNAGAINVSESSLLLDGTADNTGNLTLDLGSVLHGTADASLTNTGQIAGNGSLGDPFLTIDNQGLIVSGLLGLEIDPESSVMTNAGTLESDGPSALLGYYLLQLVSGFGDFTIDNQGGTIEALDGGDVDIDATYSSALAGFPYPPAVATIEGGTLETSGGGQIELSSDTVFTGIVPVRLGLTHVILDEDLGLTNNGTVKLDSGVSLTLQGNITNTGTINLNDSSNELVIAGNVLLSGNGTVYLNGGSLLSNGSPTTLSNSNAIMDSSVPTLGTLPDGISVVGDDNMTLENQGVIESVAEGLNLALAPGTTINSGTIEADGAATTFAVSYGMLELTSDEGNFVIDNQGGTIEAINQGTLEIAANFALQVGPFQIVADARIEGGTLTTANGGVIEIESALSLDGATHGALTNSGNIEDDFEADVPAGFFGAQVDILGEIDNTGTISLDEANQSIVIYGNASLEGSGSVKLTDASDRIESNGSAAILINDNVISGEGTIGDSFLALDNQGLIESDGAGLSIEIETATTMTNAGVLLSEGSGIFSEQTVLQLMSLYGSFAIDNVGGTIEALDGGLVQIGATTSGDPLLGLPLPTPVATIEGGTLATDATSFIEVQGNVLLTGIAPVLVGRLFQNEDVGLTNSGGVVVEADSVLQLQGTINNILGGSLNLDGPDSTLVIDGDVSLTGNGSVETFDGTNAIASDGAPSTLTTSNLIAGVGTVGDSNLTLDITEGGGIEAKAGVLTVNTSSNVITNDGQLMTDEAGDLVLASNVTGTGNAVIDSGRIELGGIFSEAVSFTTAAAGSLQIDHIADFGSTISGFAEGDTIILRDVKYDASGSAGIEPGSGNVLQVVENGVSYTLDLDPGQDFDGHTFKISQDATSGTDITLVQSPITMLTPIPSGEYAFNLVVDGGGKLIVPDEGIALNASVNAGGAVEVQSGGKTSGGSAGGGGSQTVMSGGATEQFTVSDGGYQYVGSGGDADNTTLADPGVQIVVAGGLATNTIDDGGEQDVYGSAIGTIIENGGLEVIESGGVAIETVVSSGGNLTVSAGGTLEDFTTYENNGAIGVSGGVADGDDTLGAPDIGTTVSNGGTMTVFSGGILDGITALVSGGEAILSAGAVTNGTFDFSGGGNTLEIGGTTMPTGEIDGFGTGDTIDLSSVANVAGSHANMDYSNSLLTITEGASSYQLQFDPDQNFTGDYFHLAADHAGLGPGTDITEDATPCYCRGTLIGTGRGQKRIEELKIDDMITTMSGALRPIKWIGRRSYLGRFVMGRKDILPICFKAGSIDDNMPSRDLWISPHHAMYFHIEAFGGLLIEAKDLVNGTSIVQAEHIEELEYFHVELDDHDVIVAEGALSETFIDDDSRGMFHNAHEYVALYARKRATSARYCAPRLDEGYEIEAVRQRLALRAGLLRLTDAPRLHALRGYANIVSQGKASRFSG